MIYYLLQVILNRLKIYFTRHYKYQFCALKIICWIIIFSLVGNAVYIYIHIIPITLYLVSVMETSSFLTWHAWICSTWEIWSRYLERHMSKVDKSGEINCNISSNGNVKKKTHRTSKNSFREKNTKNKHFLMSVIHSFTGAHVHKSNK